MENNLTMKEYILFIISLFTIIFVILFLWNCMKVLIKTNKKRRSLIWHLCSMVECMNVIGSSRYKDGRAYKVTSHILSRKYENENIRLAEEQKQLIKK